MNEPRVRHILPISGGKDSAALAIFMRDRVPDMEYVFCDTGEELPETYEFLKKLEAFLAKPIIRLNADKPFEHYVKLKGGYLPSPQIRWCTSEMKIIPYERYIGDDIVVSYVGIRADEARDGMISTKPNITTNFPFKEHGITIHDVRRILLESGVGYPSYYSWRSRSGCYFCFFQRNIEWVGLLENHPDLYEKAMAFEKAAGDGQRQYTWSQSGSLEDLRRPERIAQIKEEYQRAQARFASKLSKDAPLYEVFESEDGYEDESGQLPCLICTL